MVDIGVSDYLKPEEIMKTINPADLEKSADDIIELSKNNAIEEKNRYQFDDITVLLYRH